MQRRKFAVCGYSLAALVLLAGMVFGQQGNTLTLHFNGPPPGGCAPIMFGVNDINGDLYDCQLGAWHLVGPGALGITGTGVAGQVAYFTAGQVIAGDTGLTYNVATDTLTIGIGGVITAGTAGLINFPCSATVPAASGDIRLVTGPPCTLQYHNGTAAVTVALSPRTSLMSYEGVCQNVTASFSFDTSAATAPAAACIVGANVLNRAVLDFDAAADESVYGSFWLPTDWVGAIDVSVEAQANEASAASARLGLQTSCIDDNEAYDAAFNAAQTWAWVGSGTANQRVISTQTGLTLTTCTAGDRFFFRFYRDADGTSGTDDLAVDLRVVAVRFTMRRP